MKKAKIFSVYFDEIIKKIESLDEQFVNDISFYSSSHWPPRANSTARLNMANYKALDMLADKYEIVHHYCISFDNELKSAFSNFDFVVIHQNASKQTFSILHKLLDFINDHKVTAKLIFGTEGTWSTTKEFLTEENISDIYFSHLLLRHTAKTDREVYASNDHIRAKVEEFELGIDTDLLSFGKGVKERKYITFVKAPEGRLTKNNPAIDHIIEQINKTNLADRFQVKVIVPPYSSKEYWDLMAETMFFIFVSNSETFSYCLNDAKSLGAITFYPNHMYCTKIGARFVVDNYPCLGKRYSSVQNLIQQMEKISANEVVLSLESKFSRKQVVDKFSISAVSKNWDSIFSERGYRKNKLFIFSERMKIGDVVSYCKKNGFDFAMPYRNKAVVAWHDQQFSYVDSLSEIIFIKDYLTEVDGLLRRSFVIDNGIFQFSLGADVSVEKFDETMSFFSLITRINKIDKVVMDKNIDNNTLEKVVSYVN
ncbi:hypothetical protein [Candidatus Sororendozoicomonas aggregata]|uniref:hypothetical protein n=1 Tax=Candidatus Sororendozoicomonas aggregata TaxID=3073239 RepID=UPI002ED04BE6